MRLTRTSLRWGSDAGITLAETVVSVLAGSIVLAAAAALFVPAAQNSDRDRRAGQNLAVANRVSALLQRQVRDATAVSTSDSGRILSLCTYPTASSATRSTTYWKFDASATTLTTGTSLSGTTLGGNLALQGDTKTFSSVAFSAAATPLATGQSLTTTLVTSGATGTGTTTGVPSTTLAVTSSPRSEQRVSCP